MKVELTDLVVLYTRRQDLDSWGCLILLLMLLPLELLSLRLLGSLLSEIFHHLFLESFVALNVLRSHHLLELLIKLLLASTTLFLGLGFRRLRRSFRLLSLASLLLFLEALILSAHGIFHSTPLSCKLNGDCKKVATICEQGVVLVKRVN